MYTNVNMLFKLVSVHQNVDRTWQSSTRVYGALLWTPLGLHASDQALEMRYSF